MVKIKKQISGEKISTGKYKVTDAATSNLIPGQKVLVYTSTNQNIVAATGRVIGKKENVLGTGKVKMADGALVVELLESASPRYRVIAPKRTALSAKSIKSIGHLHKKKTISPTGKVFIKTIEE